MAGQPNPLQRTPLRKYGFKRQALFQGNQWVFINSEFWPYFGGEQVDDRHVIKQPVFLVQNPAVSEPLQARHGGIEGHDRTAAETCLGSKEWEQAGGKWWLWINSHCFILFPYNMGIKSSTQFRRSLYTKLYRWWSHIFLNFHPTKVGKDYHIFDEYFSNGWFNHHLLKLCTKKRPPSF